MAVADGEQSRFGQRDIRKWQKNQTQFKTSCSAHWHSALRPEHNSCGKAVAMMKRCCHES